MKFNGSELWDEWFSKLHQENAVDFFFRLRLANMLIKALKTLVWHLSREPSSEINNLKKKNDI